MTEARWRSKRISSARNRPKPLK